MAIKKEWLRKIIISGAIVELLWILAILLRDNFQSIQEAQNSARWMKSEAGAPC